MGIKNLSNDVLLVVLPSKGPKITHELKERIEDEEKRLELRETRLIMKFAKLESTLAILQTQVAGLFGSGLI